MCALRLLTFFSQSHVRDKMIHVLDTVRAPGRDRTLERLQGCLDAASKEV